jgi:hypothetical protein
VNAKGNLFESKLKVSTYDKIIAHESTSTDEASMASPTEYNRKRKQNEEEYESQTPTHRPTNIDTVVHTPNKRQMYHEEVVR